jgi:hypothetical protein
MHGRGHRAVWRPCQRLFRICETISFTRRKIRPTAGLLKADDGGADLEAEMSRTKLVRSAAIRQGGADTCPQ